MVGKIPIDADDAGFVIDRKSTLGYLHVLG